MLPRAMKGGMAGKQGEGYRGPPWAPCHVEMVAHIKCFFFLVSRFLFRSSFSGRENSDEPRFPLPGG